MSEEAIELDLKDVQATVLRPRPAPYRGRYTLLRVDDAAEGREMVRRVLPGVAPADAWWESKLPGWLGIAFTHSGPKALGLPAESLDSFPPEFQQGMAARAAVLHDSGRNAPEHWDAPFGSKDVHVALAFYAKDEAGLQELVSFAEKQHEDLSRVVILYTLYFSELPEGRNPFGFKDGLHNPLVEGVHLDVPGYAPDHHGELSSDGSAPIKTGEILLGYPNQLGFRSQCPEPLELRRNGTFIAFRKFYADVAQFRRYLRENSSSPEEEELLAAKMVGRWRSGAPLVLAPDRDDPPLGADPNRNNEFLYKDDAQGMRCPMGAHMRRVNPRDSLDGGVVDVNLHKFMRRGTNFGEPLPEGVMDDDGKERGGVFLFIGAHLDRQFEFVQSQWITDSDFIGQGREQDPLLGNAEEEGTYTIPRKPIRKRLQGLPQFVTVRGGEYCFMPGIQALRWIADVGSEKKS